jgi:hypothetical protein
LKKVTENWSTAKRLTVLLFDEISIKNGLEYNKSNDCIERFEAGLSLYFVSSNFRMNLQDLGELRRTESYGTHVLTFIIRGLAEPFIFYVGQRNIKHIFFSCFRLLHMSKSRPKVRWIYRLVLDLQEFR